MPAVRHSRQAQVVWGSAGGADFGGGLDGAGDVTGVEDGDQGGVGGDGGHDGFGGEAAGLGVGIDAGPGYLAAGFFGKGVQGADDGVVLHLGCDDVDGFAWGGEEAVADDALDGEV